MGKSKVERLKKPTHIALWWWLPECYVKEGKGSRKEYWSVVYEGPDTELVGEFVGPLKAPVWEKE